MTHNLRQSNRNLVDTNRQPDQKNRRDSAWNAGHRPGSRLVRLQLPETVLGAPFKRQTIPLKKILVRFPFSRVL